MEPKSMDFDDKIENDYNDKINFYENKMQMLEDELEVVVKQKVQAAEYGLMLLEKNKEYESLLEDRQFQIEQYLNEVNNLKQEIYKLRAASLYDNEINNESEGIDDPYIKTQQNNKTNKITNNFESNKAFTDIINDIERKYENEILVHKSKIGELRQELKESKGLIKTKNEVLNEKENEITKLEQHNQVLSKSIEKYNQMIQNMEDVRIQSDHFRLQNKVQEGKLNILLEEKLKYEKELDEFKELYKELRKENSRLMTAIGKSKNILSPDELTDRREYKENTAESSPSQYCNSYQSIYDEMKLLKQSVEEEKLLVESKSGKNTNVQNYAILLEILNEINDLRSKYISESTSSKQVIQLNGEASKYQNFIVEMTKGIEATLKQLSYMSNLIKNNSEFSYGISIHEATTTNDYEELFKIYNLNIKEINMLFNKLKNYIILSKGEATTGDNSQNLLNTNNYKMKLTNIELKEMSENLRNLRNQLAESKAAQTKLRYELDTIKSKEKNKRIEAYCKLQIVQFELELTSNKYKTLQVRYKYDTNSHRKEVQSLLEQLQASVRQKVALQHKLEEMDLSRNYRVHTANAAVVNAFSKQSEDLLSSRKHQIPKNPFIPPKF